MDSAPERVDTDGKSIVGPETLLMLIRWTWDRSGNDIDLRSGASLISIKVALVKTLASMEVRNGVVG